MVFYIGLICVFLRSIFGWLSAKPKNYPPGPPVQPLVGNFPFCQRQQIHLMMEELKLEYGPIIGLQIPREYFVMVAGGKEALEAMKKEEFIGRPKKVWYQFSRPGIMLMNGELWWDQRNFTIRHLREFGLNKRGMEKLIHEEVEELFNKIISKKEKHNMKDLFVTPSINVLWAVMGGNRFSYEDAELKTLVDVLNLYFQTQAKIGFFRQSKIVQKLFPTWAGVYEKEMYENLFVDFIQKVIKEHRQTMSDETRDFIDLYLKKLENPDLKPSFSQETLIAICMDLFSGGAQPVHHSLAFLILYSVLYPEWQEKIYDEIVSVVGKDRKPGVDDKNWLPHTMAFMAEVMRSNPISPITIPRRTTASTTFQDYTIPENAVIFISQHAILNDKEHWGDPENFRPERFLDEEGHYKKDEWLIVFGGGKRVCIGQEFSEICLFLLFTALILEYKIELPEGDPMPSITPVPGFTFSPQPFDVSFKKRLF